MESKELQLIADKGALFFLEQFDEDSESFCDTKKLLERKIKGDNPSKEEWRENAYANVNANAYANVIAYAYAYAYANAYANAIAIAYANKTIDYIIELLGDYLEQVNNLDQLILSAVETDGCQLDMGTYHFCGSTHCRAGWAIHLSPVGYELEKYFGSWMAGAILYKKSTDRVPDFFASNKDTLNDMRARASA